MDTWLNEVLRLSTATCVILSLVTEEQPWRCPLDLQSAFTPAEAEECCRLTMKARKCGAWDAIMHRVHDAEDLALGEAWSPSLSGSMSDGSKRLREDRAPSTPVVYGSGYYYTTADPPMPSEKTLIPSSGPGGDLPHGVLTITQWGKTAVSFGKYKGSKSYAEMFEGTSEDLASYRSYCQSHYQSGSPALRDLVDYFRARGMHHEASQSVIPGSTIRSVYKNT